MMRVVGFEGVVVETNRPGRVGLRQREWLELDRLGRVGIEHDLAGLDLLTVEVE